MFHQVRSGPLVGRDGRCVVQRERSFRPAGVVQRGAWTSASFSGPAQEYIGCIGAAAAADDWRQTAEEIRVR